MMNTSPGPDQPYVVPQPAKRMERGMDKNGNFMFGQVGMQQRKSALWDRVMRENGKYKHCSHGKDYLGAGYKPARALINNVLEC